MNTIEINRAEDFLKKVRDSGKTVDARKNGHVITMEEREGSHLLRVINIHPGKDTLDCCLKDLAAIAQEFAVPFTSPASSVPAPAEVSVGDKIKFQHGHSDGSMVTFFVTVLRVGKAKNGNPAALVSVPSKVQSIPFAPFGGKAQTWVDLTKVAQGSALPAPAEDVAKAPVAGVRMDRKSSQFVPTLDGKDLSPTSFDEDRALRIAQEAAATPSPAEPVKVAHTPLPYSFGESSDEVIAANGEPIAACPDGADYDQWLVNGPLIVTARNSHAAYLAKIQALEALLLDCVRDMTANHIVDNILFKEKNPTRPDLPEPASLVAARAALSLPSVG
jgi:hypothetical protein